MGKRHFRALFEAQWSASKFVCVGLDSDHGKIPKEIRNWASEAPNDESVKRELAICRFNEEIVDATADVALAFKPNLAFYLRHGDAGLRALAHTTAYIQARYPKVPIILDAKEADIESTNIGYVEHAFEICGADAITLHPYLGSEALRPFLEREDKGCLILCRTSNKGAGEFQDLKVKCPLAELEFPPEWPLYQHVAHSVAQYWNTRGNCGVVVGATYPEELAAVRRVIGDIPILIPGIGAQGGDLERSVKAGLNRARHGIIVNSSRGIIFASNGPDFAKVARQETVKLHEAILAARASKE